MMLDENPMFDAVTVQSAERVPSGLESPAYWKQSNYCYTSPTWWIDYF